MLVRQGGARLPSNLGNLAPFDPAPAARRLVDLLETKIARLLGNLGHHLGLKGKLIGETKTARLRGNLAQMIVFQLPAHCTLNSSFLGLPYRIRNINHKKGAT